MKKTRIAFAALLLAGSGWCMAADVVVLRGGARIDLKSPWVQQGNTAILTRTDGTLLSVPVTEIDLKATAAVKARKPEAAAPAVVAPPSAPADAVRSGRGEKARVKVTDADVGHVEAAATGPADRGEKADTRANAPRVEVGDYTQQKSGPNLVITGVLHNNGTTPALNARLNIAAIDDTGNSFASASATLSNGTIEGGRGVTFSAAVPIGDRNASSLRFVPLWQNPAPPAPANGAAPAAGAAAAASGAAPSSSEPATASKPPAPAPTPYGRGTLYAAPAPSAPMVPPADGRGGYIPGASSPDNQPKTPQ